MRVFFYRYVYNPFGCVLQRTRTPVVAQFYIKVQSNSRRSSTQTVASRMFKRFSTGRRAQKVNDGFIFLNLQNVFLYYYYFLCFIRNPKYTQAHSRKNLTRHSVSTTVRASTLLCIYACVFEVCVRVCARLGYK